GADLPADPVAPPDFGAGEGGRGWADRGGSPRGSGAAVSRAARTTPRADGRGTAVYQRVRQRNRDPDAAGSGDAAARWRRSVDHPGDGRRDRLARAWTCLSSRGRAG